MNRPPQRRAVVAGLLAAAALGALIVIGSRRLAHFDAALVAYTFATLFAVFGVTYRAPRRPQVPAPLRPPVLGRGLPLGMYTVATVRLASAAEVPSLLAIPRISVYVALAAWALAFVGLVARLLARRAPPP